MSVTTKMKGRPIISGLPLTVLFWCTVGFVLGGTEDVAKADPFLPKSVDQVLEVLPKSVLSSRSEVIELRDRLATDPDNVRLASSVARRYLALNRSSGDPRFLGYAQAAIRPWWTSRNPPFEVLPVRAKLKEKNHLYGQAVRDLRQLLVEQPNDAQAWIELSNIYRVQGRYAEAWNACNQLKLVAGEYPVALSTIPLKALTGEARDAARHLSIILPVAERNWPGTTEWVVTLQAQVAVALGRNDEAETHFLKGLQINPDSYYLLREFGDFLLDAGRSKEAVSLMRDHTADNGVLLLAALAAQQNGDERLCETWKNELTRRFEEIRMRNGEPHGRFESRFELELNGDAKAALGIATRNWARQKEVRDTRCVLETAIAAGNPESAQPVIDFLEQHGTEHVILQRLVDQLEQSKR